MDKISQPAQYLEWWGFVLVIIGAIFHALHVVNVKNMQKKGLPSDVITTLFTLLSGGLFLILSFLFNPPQIWSIFHLQIGIFWPLFATCALNVIIQFASIRAQEYADPTMVSAVGGFQPFISLLPAWLILGETPNEIGYVGLVLIAVGIYVTSLSQKIGDPAKVPA